MMKIKPKRLFIIILLGLVLLSGCNNEVSVSASEIVNKAVEFEDKPMDYYGEATVKIKEDGKLINDIKVKDYLNGKTQKTISKDSITKEAAHALLIDGKLLIYDETNKVAYDSVIDEEVLQDAFSPRQQFKTVLETYKDSHDYKTVGEERVAGLNTHHMIFTAKEDDNLLGDMEMWVDEKSWVVVKMIYRTGNMDIEIEYTKMDLKPSFSDDTFTLDIPKDIKIESMDEMLGEADNVITEEEADNVFEQKFLKLQEKDLKLEKIKLFDLEKVAGRKELNLIYVDKEGIPAVNLSVFPQPKEKEFQIDKNKDFKVRGKPAEKEKSISMISWDEAGLRYVIMLDDPSLSLSDAKEIAERMK